MCNCENLLTQHVDYRCTCDKTNDCQTIIEWYCNDCGYKSEMSCNVCQKCFPHGKSEHEKIRKTQCYDCATKLEECPICGYYSCECGSFEYYWGAN